MKTFRTKLYKSVGHYFILGRAAAESHLNELDEASEILRKSAGNRVTIRNYLRTIGFGKVTPRVRALLSILVRRTITEISKEQEAFRAILGSSLRTWEMS